MDIKRAMEHYKNRIDTMNAFENVAKENGIKLTDYQLGQTAGIRSMITNILNELNEEAEQ